MNSRTSAILTIASDTQSCCPSRAMPFFTEGPSRGASECHLSSTVIYLFIYLFVDFFVCSNNNNIINNKYCFLTGDLESFLQPDDKDTDEHILRGCAVYRASKHAQYQTDIMFAAEQGHHHNGDQATRRPHMMCSICVVADFPHLRLGVCVIGMSSFGSPSMHSY